MNSFISSFRALLAALAIIVLVEGGYSVDNASSPVERSNYLNWNFNSDELFHKVVIYEKLQTAVRNKPDIIQVGDSSGFHGIVPRIVDQYLGGLKYENLSCCANTGFDGYYSITDFMLRNTPEIKAVVLYISLNNPPRDPASVETGVVGGADRIRNAFGVLAPFTSPPTLSAREDLVSAVYTLGNAVSHRGLMPLSTMWPELIRFLQTERGWFPEHDPHQVPERQADMLTALCGPTGVRTVGGHSPEDFTRDIFGTRRSYAAVELRRLADLAARHNAKLVLMIQPYPCELAGSLVPALQSDIAAVMADYSNVIVPDRALYERWPGPWFVSADHLKIGHEDAASRRVGRAVAKAMNVSFVEPRQPPAPKPPVSIWSSSDFTATSWQAEGLLLTRQPNGKGVLAVETADAGRHYVRMTVPDLQPQRYIASITFRTASPRHVYLDVSSLHAPGNYLYFHCSESLLESTRSTDVLDSEIEELPGHVFRCWGKFKLTTRGATIGIGLSPRKYDAGPHQGDGQSSVVLYEAELSVVDGSEE